MKLHVSVLCKWDYVEMEKKTKKNMRIVMGIEAGSYVIHTKKILFCSYMIYYMYYVYRVFIMCNSILYEY